MRFSIPVFATLIETHVISLKLQNMSTSMRGAQLIKLLQQQDQKPLNLNNTDENSSTKS